MQQNWIAMVSDFLYNSILNQFPYSPTEGQDGLIRALAQFCYRREERSCFILRGYAGTGKTSVVAALVKALHEVNKPTVLLAPTGRAAKVLSHYACFPAFTIHKTIYHESQQRGMDSLFELKYNKAQDTLFIVDEASMIGTDSDQRAFGSGNLLEDLLQFVYQGSGCALLFVGDDAQLPPVGQSYSAALHKEAIEAIGLSVKDYTLTEVVRQAMDSGVLYEATALRNHLLKGDKQSAYGTISPHPDVVRLKPEQVLESLESSYRDAGREETLVITRSNKRTNLYNQGIRARILWMDQQLQTGDRVMVSRNNYFWLEDSFLANGESLSVVRLRNEREMYGFHFADAHLEMIDSDQELTATLWLDTLQTETPEENYRLQRELYYKIAEDYPELARNRKKLRDKIMESPYYNALQIRYAYAVTCHKSQGGQWKHIYIDAGALTNKDVAEIDDWRWLYTAMTRSSEKVFLLK